METVLSSIVVIFLIIFAMFSFGEAVIDSTTGLSETGQSLVHDAAIDARTHLRFVDAYSTAAGRQIFLVLENDGDNRLVDFENWDSIIHYFDPLLSNNYHINWLAYTANNANTGQWQVAGIYEDAGAEMSEVFEPHVLNPSEQIVLKLVLPEAAASGTSAQAVITTSKGFTTSYQFHINLAPELTVNTGLFLPEHNQATLTSAMLETLDNDDTADELIYTISSPSIEGTVNLAQFSQAELNSGLVTYSHTGTGDDSFDFTVSDGKDFIGSYSFTISINDAPILVSNTGLASAINASDYINTPLLSFTDPDNSADELIYNIIVPPSHGILNLGASFSQAQVDSKQLYYTNQGLAGDSFQFTLSDGASTVGPFTFIISTP